MSLIRLLLILLLTALPFTGCEKVELPDGNNSEEKDDGDDNKDDDDGDDAETYSDTLTVLQALSATAEDEIIVKGYIVGYIDGTSLKQAAFGLPSKANTNMLLADSPDETDVTRCLPVKLAADGSVSYRDELNLFDNPEYLGACIAIDGWLSTYFTVNGIKEIYDYEWVSFSSIEDPGGQTGPEDPDEPGNPDESDEVVTPGISDDSEVVDGR